MEMFQVARTGLPDLEFMGECIANSQGEVPAETDGDRWHDLNVYRAADGEIIVSIAYQTTHPEESSDNYVETAASLEEVEGVLSLYNPIERVNEDAIAGQRKPVQSVLQAITRRYDLQVNDVLEQLQKATATV